MPTVRVTGEGLEWLSEKERFLYVGRKVYPKGALVAKMSLS